MEKTKSTILTLYPKEVSQEVLCDAHQWQTQLGWSYTMWLFGVRLATDHRDSEGNIPANLRVMLGNLSVFLLSVSRIHSNKVNHLLKQLKHAQSRIERGDFVVRRDSLDHQLYVVNTKVPDEICRIPRHVVLMIKSIPSCEVVWVHENYVYVFKKPLATVLSKRPDQIYRGPFLVRWSFEMIKP